MWVGGVRVIILDERNRVLMVRQHHEGRDIWMVPGGGIEDGETSSQAGVREVREETGLDVKIGKLMCHLEVLYPEYLKDELWRFLEEDYHGYNAFKIRT